MSGFDEQDEMARKIGRAIHSIALANKKVCKAKELHTHQEQSITRSHLKAQKLLWQVFDQLKGYDDVKIRDKEEEGHAENP